MKHPLFWHVTRDNVSVQFLTLEGRADGFTRNVGKYLISFVFCLLGNSPASEFYKRTFREISVSSIFKNSVNKKITKMEQTVFFETSAYKIQEPGNCSKDRIQNW